MDAFVPKKQRKADIGSFRKNAILKFFSNILILKQTDKKSLEGVINHMYVQFEVIVKTNSQENRKDIWAFFPKKQRKADICSFRTNAMLKFFSNILIGISIQTH